MGDVDPEPVHPAFEPEVHRVLELGRHGGVRPVDIRLLGREEVQVPLARAPVGFGHPRPGRAAEAADPVVGSLRAVGAAAVAEDEAFALGRAGRRGQGLLEPLVLIGDVVGHEVEQHADPVLVGLGDHRLGIREGPEHGLDVPEIGRRRSPHPSSGTGTRG